MERELLRDMIQDRDRRIASIRRKMEIQEEKMSRFKRELALIKERRMISEIAHIEQLTQLMEDKERGEKALDRLQQDLKKQQGDSLQLYAEVIKKDASKIPEATDSSYVMRMQAQLCKCMHSMGIVENQMELVKETCEELIKSLKDAITKTMEEKSQVELKFMNELVMTDNERQDLEKELKERLEQLRNQISHIEERLEDIEDAKEDDSGDEDDEEEESEKNGMRKELRERSEEIEALQQEIAEQKEQIDELKKALGSETDGAEEKVEESNQEEEDEDDQGLLTEDESIDDSA